MKELERVQLLSQQWSQRRPLKNDTRRCILWLFFRKYKMHVNISRVNASHATMTRLFGRTS